MTIDKEDVIAKVTASAFGQPLVTNVLRGHVVEAMVALALEPEWRWCSGDYAAWDFERADGLRMEVRQSAYRQSWVQAPHLKVSRGVRHSAPEVRLGVRKPQRADRASCTGLCVRLPRCPRRYGRSSRTRAMGFLRRPDKCLA